VQFDFTLPERFQLEYVGEDGKRHQPLMVHRALYGSIERFFGTLIEHYAGAFPVWLSPVQVVVIPIGEKHHAYAHEVGEKLKSAGVRGQVDDRNEKMNAKIREHALQKVPFQLVIGDKEVESGQVNVRVRGQERAEGCVAADTFVDRMKKLIETRAARL
jgi:threonyl-tRNA synthetase